MAALYVGLDVGTSGVRAVACSEYGAVAAQASRALPASDNPAPGHVEQDPDAWWDAVTQVLRELRAGIDAGAEIRAITVDSTSGTVVAVGADGAVLRPAILYNDRRAAEEADELNEAASDLCARMGYRFNASYGLPKMLWIARHEPEIAERCGRFLHAADFVAGRLLGRYDTTDASNVLKSGFDLHKQQWPPCLAQVQALPFDKLPRVVPSGSVLGPVCAAAAERTGLPATAVVVAGATDGTAGALALGAAEPGEAATTLGSTLVVKAVARACVVDPQGRVYSHVHPAGGWMPGGASNTGCAVLDRRFDRARYGELTLAAADRVPSDVLLYPLDGKGERFPVVAPEFEEFRRGTPRDDAERFAAHLQGIAFVERWSYEVLEELGCPVGPVVRSTGGGSRNPLWNKVRAAVLGRELRISTVAESALGAAMLAAAPAAFGGSVAAATSAMAHMTGQCVPQPRLIAAFDERYRAFREAIGR